MFSTTKNAELLKGWRTVIGYKVSKKGLFKFNQLLD